MIPYSELAGAPAAPADHRIAYGAEPLQFGELRLPATGNALVPIVVLLHGGCWRSAYDLRHISPAAAAITSTGVATWTIEYRRLGDAVGGWPGTFHDVAQAVDHVRTLAGRFPVDTMRVVLAGHSAGGQLALWAASRRASDRANIPALSAYPLRVSGVISLAGITDLAAYGAAPGSCNSSVTPLLGGTPAEHPERYAAVSPIQRLPIGARVRLVHGAADPIVPVSQSQLFVDRARAAGEIDFDLEIVPDAGHFDLVAPQAEAWAAVLRAVRSLTGPR